MPTTSRILKSLLLRGPDIISSDKIEIFYNNFDAIIIGSGTTFSNIEITAIENILQEKKLKITSSTRIDIVAHGFLDVDENLNIIAKNGVETDVRSYFFELQKLSDYPLYINLRCCYSKYASKAVDILKPGSILITHTGLEGHTRINNFALRKSLQHFFRDSSIIPEHQFILDLPEDFETSAFTKHSIDQKIYKYETRNFLDTQDSYSIYTLYKDLTLDTCNYFQLQPDAITSDYRSLSKGILPISPFLLCRYYYITR